MLAISLFIKNAFGWTVAHWKLLALIAVGILIVILGGIAFQSCGSKPSLDEKEIQKAQEAIAIQDRKVMVEILAQSDAREEVGDRIDAEAKSDLVNKIEESKQKWAGATNEELAAELERRK